MATDEKEIDDVMPGKELGSKEVVLDEKLMQCYIGGVEPENPWYKGDSPWGGPVAPAAVLALEAWGWPGAQPPGGRGGVAARMTFELIKPMRPGQKLILKGRISDRYVRRNRQFITVEIPTYDEAGELVCIFSGTLASVVDPATVRADVPRRD